jgi:two-component system, OmpR family, phosphate regulon sensor histidine kinase PhoR
MQSDPVKPDSETMSVLVVDDEDGMREGMRRILGRVGYHVAVADGGVEAIRMIDSGQYDLALIDLRMPEIDGFAVTDYIARRPGNKTIVVIVSALATVEAAVETTRKGAFDFLVKPFAPADLLSVVERAGRQCRLLQEHEKYLVELDGERSLSRSLINSMREGVIVFNLRQEVVLLNPRAEFYLGTRYRSGMTSGDLGFDPGFPDMVRGVLSGDSGEKLLDQEIGEQRVRTRITPYVRGQEVGGAIVLLHDFTEEWRAEQDKNRFVSMVAHELRGPLAAILNYLNLILDHSVDDEPERVRELLERSRKRGEALLELVGDLLFLNKRNAGKAEKSLEILDLSEVLTDEVAFVEGHAQRANVTVRYAAQEESFPFLADRGDLDRIFLNLMFNGIKYNRPGGSLSITIRRTDDGHWFEVSFRDTGIGMTDEEMKNLFQDFFRVLNSKTKSIPGTGLGLSTAKRVLSEYNGRITVESKPDEGSTFTVLLPTRDSLNG